MLIKTEIKILSTLIAMLTLCLCLVSFACCKKEETHVYKREGNYIYFGTYLQSVKDVDVTVTKESEESIYYIGSDGAKYRRARANIATGRTYTFSTGEQVVANEIYFFKLEPIRWRIVSESNGEAILLCDRIIYNRAFDGDNNSWKYSSVRSWLNDEFYNSVFNESERAIIQTTLVDNSIESTGYVESDFSYEYSCENTQDKIYLLSYAEAKSFCTTSEREKKTTDYAIASGAYTYTTSMDNYRYYGNGIWWLRSPSNVNLDYLRDVDGDGGMRNIKKVSDATHGIVPALRIKL